MVSASWAAQGHGPCEQIVAACSAAGFVRGGEKAGNGLWVHCIAPLMQGTPQSHRTSRPLPQVDPQIVEVCKSSNPDFGMMKGTPLEVTAFDIDIHVPLIVTGPGVPAGRTVEEIFENIDLCPTFAALARAGAPANVDGHSLVPLLHGHEVAEWQTVALIEHHWPLRDRSGPDASGRRSGNPLTYDAIMTRTSVYVEYATGENKHHDLVSDPHELRTTFPSLPDKDKKSLHVVLESIRPCHDAKTCWAAGRASLDIAQDNE